MAESANVRVVINALTESAEQAIDSVGDEITGLGSDAAVGQTALDQLSDEFGEATAQSMILQRAMSSLEENMDDVAQSGLYAQTAMDQFNDELTETTTSSGIASGALTALQGSMSGTAVASTALSVAFKLSLIPAILTLSTVLAPLVATFAALTAGAFALAGAFGAIVGSGLLAFGQKKAKQNKKELAQTKRLIAQYESLKQQTGSLTAAQQNRLEQLRKKKKRLEGTTTAMGALQNQMKQLKKELVPMIAAFGEQFIPLIEDAINAIPTLVQAMINSVGSTEEFRSALREFGAAAMEIIPALTGFMFDLARTALPLLMELFGFLRAKGPGAWRAIMASVQKLEPELRSLLDALIQMAPVLLKFGTNVAEVVIPALTDLIKIGTGFMEWINGMSEGFQNAAIAGLILAPVFLKLVSVLSTVLQFFTGGGILANLANLITYFSSASTVTGALSNALGVLAGYLSSAAAWLTGTVAGAAVLGAAIGGLVVKLLHMTGVMDMIGDVASSLGNMLGQELVSHFLSAVSVLTGGLLPALAILGGFINGLLTGGLDKAIANVKRIGQIFLTSWKTSIDAVISALVSFGGFLKQFFFTTLPSVVMGALGAIWKGLVQFFTKDLPKMALRGLVAFVALVEQQFNRMFNVVADIWNGLVSFVASVTEKLINAGINAINAFLSTLDSVADKVSQIPGVGDMNVGTLDEVSINRNIGQVDRRTTDYSQIRGRRRQQAQQVINGGVTVNVDAQGNVQRNPYQWSRRAGQQLQRELRSKYGSGNRGGQ